MMNTLIHAENISFSYHDEPILENVSFEIKKGDYVGLVGPNGSGKSTLIKIILGLLSPSSGQVKLFDQPLSGFRDWERVGYVPQHVFRGERSFPATVREVVESGHVKENPFWCQFGVRECGPIDEALAITGVRHLLRRRIGELSGGERQRVFIARALVSHPELLILDEPTTGVDQASQEAFYDFLQELNTKHKLTILLISHDLEAITHEAKTAICLNRRIVYTGLASTLHSAEAVEKMFGPHIQAGHRV